MVFGNRDSITVSIESTFGIFETILVYFRSLIVTRGETFGREDIPVK